MNVAIFTSCALRHRAFAAIACKSKTLNVVAVFHEEGKPLSELVQCNPKADLERQHLSGRDQAEQDFFGLFLENQPLPTNIIKAVPRGWFSTQQCIDELRSCEIEIILVYGTSIIKGAIIKEYENKILNVHLGLSPYYRGSGTNYFPFVNGEPEYCGATFMYLDSGVDTGEIIHQIRPYILKTDSFHQLSNRFLISVFKTYVAVAESYAKLESPPRISPSQEINRTRRLYRKVDFTRESVESLYANIDSGILAKYLDSYHERNCLVPLIQQKFLLEDA